jgi:hypothetical protein
MPHSGHCLFPGCLPVSTSNWLVSTTLDCVYRPLVSFYRPLIGVHRHLSNVCHHLAAVCHLLARVYQCWSVSTSLLPVLPTTELCLPPAGQCTDHGRCLPPRGRCLLHTIQCLRPAGSCLYHPLDGVYYPVLRFYRRLVVCLPPAGQCPPTTRLLVSTPCLLVSSPVPHWCKL